jgi:hypothetical protein
MKKISIAPVLLFLMLNTANAQAVAVVVDPGHIAATIANGGAIQKVKNTMEEINQVSNVISNTVQDIRQLQFQVDQALKDVKGLFHHEGFHFARIDKELAFAQLLPNDFRHYLQGMELPGTDALAEGYNNELVTLGSRILQEAFEFPLHEGLPMELQEMDALNFQQQQNRTAYSVMADRKSLQLALSFNKMADVLLSKGVQLNELLKRGVNGGWDEEEGFKMNEAERLALLEVSAANIRKAMELKLRCDELIRKSATEMDPAMAVGLSKYQQQLRLKNLASQ